MRYNNAYISSGMLKANIVYDFVYDGTYWQITGEPWEAESTLEELFGGKLPDSTLSNNAPETIRIAATHSLGANFWSVGDKVGINLSGTVGGVSLNGIYYAVIIGFNHNPTLECGHSIHFQFGKTGGGTSIAFTDSGYSGMFQTSNSARFVHGVGSSSVTDWRNSYIRDTICTQFYNALPNEWQNVIAPCVKYTYNSGDNGVTATMDKIWLLSAYEICGSISGVNNANVQNEADYQKQYTYYSNGNSKIKYKHSSTSTACDWWTRTWNGTAVSGNTKTFCAITASGGTGARIGYDSYGFAPCFAIT